MILEIPMRPFPAVVLIVTTKKLIDENTLEFILIKILWSISNCLFIGRYEKKQSSYEWTSIEMPIFVHLASSK